MKDDHLFDALVFRHDRATLGFFLQIPVDGLETWNFRPRFRLLLHLLRDHLPFSQREYHISFIAVLSSLFGRIFHQDMRISPMLD